MNQPVFKSVNIREDIGHPERLAHYQPTSRTAPLVAAVMSGGATMAIAAYGSGKSLAAGAGLIASENAPENRPFIETMAGRLAEVDPDLAERMLKRVESARRGRHVVVSGHVRDLAASISAALGLGAADTVRKAVNAIRKIDDADHVAIVWDEFGRHLEGLIAEGRSRDLDALQELSELVIRPSGPAVSLTLLLHQNVLAYAQGLNQTSRNEWRKIEGRFEQLRFVEDSKETYRLIAAVVAARGEVRRTKDPKTIAYSASAAILEGWFDGLDNANVVKSLLEDASPISAAALNVLPRLVARVGQNERSLFSFIEHIDLSAPVGMEDVYLAFGDAIRSDVGVGGLHRRWVEAESALSKAETEIERELIAAAFLLQAGVSGEKRRLRRSALAAAAVSGGYAPEDVEASINALVSRKLLLHRKLNDDMSVWHGADVDIAGRLREERLKLAPTFDPAPFLESEHPAPFVRPVRHNTEKGTSRYLTGSYATAATLEDRLSAQTSGEWGRVIYVLCDSADDVGRALDTAAKDSGRNVIVIPEGPVSLADSALEIAALISLRQDGRFMGEDPLASREVDELLTVARRQLAVSLHRLTSARPSLASWYSGGRKLDVDADRPASIAVSTLMDSWFPLTPRIVNDQIVRSNISRQMSTARIRLITRLMDNADKPALGYAPDDGSAEASVYRTVLARTGLHLERDGQGCFAPPNELEDPGLAEAWVRIERFFSFVGKRPLSYIVDELREAPIGLADGVLPILVLAGYKAFGKAVSFRTDDEFVRDVLGFASTQMFKEPRRHEVEVHASIGSTLSYLDDFAYVFAYSKPGLLEEKVIYANMALEKWASTVADGARRSKRMPPAARSLLRAITESKDPPTLILETLPSLLGGEARKAKDRFSQTLFALEAARNSVDGLIDGYLRDAVEVVEEILHLEGSEKTNVEGIHEWIRCFDVDSLLHRRDLKMTDQTILRTVRDSLNGRYSGEGLARVMSSVLLQRSIDKWQDDTRETLRKELRESRERIEAAALDTENPGKTMVPLIESRIIGLQNQLRRIEGADASRGRA